MGGHCPGCHFRRHSVCAARHQSSGRPAQTLEAHTQMTPQVAKIFERSCNDCHSNKTTWPWYSERGASFLVDDRSRNHGREHLNILSGQSSTGPTRRRPCRRCATKYWTAKCPAVVFADALRGPPCQRPTRRFCATGPKRSASEWLRNPGNLVVQTQVSCKRTIADYLRLGAPPHSAKFCAVC